MKSSCYLCDVPSLQCFNQFAAFHETWYERYVTECHPSVILPTF
jgi:hypothetical protein